jgi:Restriction endonuclease BglII
MMFDPLRDAGFEIAFTNHAEAILRYDFVDLIGELEAALIDVHVPMSEIIGGGGGETRMTQRLRRGLAERGWPKHNFELTKIVDGIAKESISHEIDHVRRTAIGTIAFEIEWNNKDPFFDRDLENFKRLHAEGAISLGVIVTRGSAMQGAMREKVAEYARVRNVADFDDLEQIGASMPTVPQRRQIEADIACGQNFVDAWARKFTVDKFGMATTHWSKLQDRIARGVGNPCPLILFGLPSSIIDMGS